MKNILKEIFIFILIIVAIILVLGVLLYDYIPTSKVVPQTIAYQTPENLKAEIEDEFIEDNSQVIITYEIDSSDLNVYKEITSYVPGKQNPFGSYNVQTNSAVTGGTGNSANGSSNETISDEEFFNNNKTK